MSVGKSVGQSRTTGNQQQQIDPVTQQYMTEIMDVARRAGQAGPSPLLTGASDWYTNAMKTGRGGLDALSGNPDAIAALMNPYQKNVIDAANAQFDYGDARAMKTVNDAATKAGAFGGSRHGVASGVALGETGRARGNTISGLLYGGYNDAMGRAGEMARMGFGAAGANANLGFGGVGSPNQWLLQMLNQGFKGPMGSSGTYANRTRGSNMNAQFEPLKMFDPMGG